MGVRNFDDHEYRVNSVDNISSYKKVVNTIDYIPSSKHGVKIRENGVETNSILICESGGASTIHDHSFIVDDDKIFLCCGDQVYCLQVPSLTILWKKNLDMFTCFGIHKFKNDFLIHGELEVSRIDHQGNKKWSVGARDIFVPPDGKKEIEITGDTILLRDWDGDEYLIDENGETIDHK